VLLVRKISRAKWDSNFNIQRGLAKGEISADAVTSDLRTQSNALSFWQCSTDSSNSIEDAVLAITAAGDRLDKLDIVWLADSELRSDGHSLKNTEGRTPVRDLVRMHVDICKLDYVRLGKIVERVHHSVQDGRWRRFTKLEIKKLLASAIIRGRIVPEHLGEGIRNEISKHIEKI